MSADVALHVLLAALAVAALWWFVGAALRAIDDSTARPRTSINAKERS